MQDKSRDNPRFCGIGVRRSAGRRQLESSPVKTSPNSETAPEPVPRDGQTVLRTPEIAHWISYRSPAWHFTVPTLTSRKGAKAQSWKCWKLESSVLPLRLCKRPAVPARLVIGGLIKSPTSCVLNTISPSQAAPVHGDNRKDSQRHGTEKLPSSVASVKSVVQIGAPCFNRRSRRLHRCATEPVSGICSKTD